MSNKGTNLKEKLRQALASTIRVISDDFEIKKHEDNKSSNKFDFFELDNLNSKSDFIKARAEADSAALKKNFLTMKFIKKTLNNSSCRPLYAIAEKTRYETLGGKMLKVLRKTLVIIIAKSST